MNHPAIKLLQPRYQYLQGNTPKTSQTKETSHWKLNPALKNHEILSLILNLSPVSNTKTPTSQTTPPS